MDQTSITNYDEIGESYIEEQAKFIDFEEDEGVQFLKKSLGDIKGKKLLDFGCGSGEIAKYFSKYGAEVYGIDSSKTMIRYAKKNIGKRAILGNHENLPFQEAFFDIILSRYALHYLTDLEKAYSQFSRVLKPRGNLCVITQHPIHDFELTGKYTLGEKIEIDLFESLNLKFPSHTMTDYFSKQFFQNFYLTDFFKGSNERGHNSYKKTPFALGFSATKIL